MKKIIILFIFFTSISIAQEISEIPSQGPLETMEFTQGSSIGFICGSNGVWRSSNDGTTWLNVYNNFFVYDIASYEEVSYAVTKNSVVKSTDSGISWNVCYEVPGGEPQRLRKITIRNQNEVYVGLTGSFEWGEVSPSKILKTINGGETWNVVFIGYGNDIRDISVNSFGNVCFVTDFAGYDTLWNSSNGNVWNSTLSPIAVFTVNNSNGIITLNGRYGSPVTTTSTDLGMTWTPIFFYNDPGFCRNIAFGKDYYSLVVNLSGEAKIFKSFNQGTNWSQLTDLPIAYSYYSIAQNSNYLFVCGVQLNSPNNAVVLRYPLSLVGINNFTPEIQNEFLLEQNFPNPFNPSTIITYSVPRKSFVTIIIFDSNGKKVETLVNKNQDIGTYEVLFSGNNLSSGVYFCRIKAGDFIETKKMILFK
jgi:photosystem II stability/assembly factor-like uncharacterized protein